MTYNGWHFHHHFFSPISQNLPRCMHFDIHSFAVLRCLETTNDNAYTIIYDLNDNGDGGCYKGCYSYVAVGAFTSI